MLSSKGCSGWMSEVITKVLLSHHFLIACGPPPAGSGLFTASGRVGADRPISQVSVPLKSEWKKHSWRLSMTRPWLGRQKGFLSQQPGAGGSVQERSAEARVTLPGKLFQLRRCPPGLPVREEDWEGPDQSPGTRGFWGRVMQWTSPGWPLQW